MIPSPTAGGVDGFVPHSGGAVFNTAVALGRLGVKTGMLTGMSSDMFGQQLTKALTDSHVDTKLLITSDRHTTLAFVKLTNGIASYTFFDENSAGRMIIKDDLPPLPDDVTALYFGGISLACEPGADAYAALIESAGKSRAVMLDPNIRPSFIQDEARYRDRLGRMFALADIVKTSDDDLDWIFPDQDTLAGKIDCARRAGPSVVILTRGAAGATAYLHDGSAISVAASAATVVDTVGAGDTFNAGVLARLSALGLLTKDALRGLDAPQIKNALEFGAKVAAVTVSRAGANPPWADEI